MNEIQSCPCFVARVEHLALTLDLKIEHLSLPLDLKASACDQKHQMH